MKDVNAKSKASKHARKDEMRAIKKSSSVYKLDPFLNEDDI